jgi:hypothetical protein
MWFKTEEGNFLPAGWWKFANGCIAIRESLTPTFVKELIQGEQPSRLPWPSTFINPNFPT